MQFIQRIEDARQSSVLSPLYHLILFYGGAGVGDARPHFGVVDRRPDAVAQRLASLGVLEFTRRFSPTSASTAHSTVPFWLLCPDVAEMIFNCGPGANFHVV